jgi:phage tail P2-like protein
MTFVGSDVLPGNASELERSWADMEWVRQAGLDPSIIRALTNPATCPVDMLPWLAWSMSVDTWDPNWPEPTKRAVIAASPETHRLKGTRKAVRLALEALGIDIEIDEWWETDPPGRRGTFKVTAWADGAPIVDAAMILALRQAIRGAKPKSRIGDLRIGLRETGALFCGGAGQTLSNARFFIETGV